MINAKPSEEKDHAKFFLIRMYYERGQIILVNGFLQTIA